MINKITRKTFKIRESGRSTDYISPSFGFGCLLDCTYCYMKRHQPNTIVNQATNIGDILTAINNHVTFLPIREPNQTHDKYYTYDISCNEDFAFHSKDYNWKRIFDYFKDSDRAFASLATKVIPKHFLTYNPDNKVRIRFSLMPQKYSTKLEPNTPPISKRIEAINTFIEAGYDVHINFSPIIVVPGWVDEYKKLFIEINDKVKYKDRVKAECIFLTHNAKKHSYNITNKKSGEELLWNPRIQEKKISQYGGDNIRYNYILKEKMKNTFIKLHTKIIPWNTIRYIF